MTVSELQFEIAIELRVWNMVREQANKRSGSYYQRALAHLHFVDHPGPEGRIGGSTGGAALLCGRCGWHGAASVWKWWRLRCNESSRFSSRAMCVMYYGYPSTPPPLYTAPPPLTKSVFLLLQTWIGYAMVCSPLSHILRILLRRRSVKGRKEPYSITVYTDINLFCRESWMSSLAETNRAAALRSGAI